MAEEANNTQQPEVKEIADVQPVVEVPVEQPEVVVAAPQQASDMEGVTPAVAPEPVVVNAEKGVETAVVPEPAKAPETRQDRIELAIKTFCKQSKVPKKPVRISKAAIGRLIRQRSTQVGSIARNLFSYDDYAIINDKGDIRFGDCVLLVQAGPFAANEAIKVIDWLPSLSTILMSQTGRVSDTVALAMAPVAFESQTPLRII